ncbi:MAG: hypothetical protein L6R43_16735, partial [Planctomycetes bacterium]|nr:hypothetical protein [Planctomycetota bacterium]
MAGPTLLEAILRANAARAAGDSSAVAALPPGAMPFVITCMDPRIVGRLIPALGLEHSPPPQAKFAGGVIRPGDVSGVRSVLAAALFNMATEVLVIGHTDCRMGKTSSMEIRNGLARLGIPADAFGGEDPVAWLGAFASERSAVQASVEALRASRRMPASMPIHGLLYHLDSRRVDLVVDGYAAAAAPRASEGATVGGYRPGPASLDAPPAPTFGAPYAPQVHSAGPGTFSLEAPPRPDFGPSRGAPAFTPGPVNLGTGSPPSSFPAPPPFAAPPPPPVPVPP